jgi:small subunit ribosomal protein S3
MGKKVHPKSIRLSINQSWSSQWFAKLAKGGAKKYRENLQEDLRLREYTKKRLKRAAIEKVIIKRSPKQVNLIIYTARPGLVIGKNGKEIDALKQELNKIISSDAALKIDIEEVRKPDTRAELLAQNIAEQLERRLPYRRVLKKTLDKINLNNEIKGVKIKISGRLNGADIARSEWLSKGSLPLQTLKAYIEYAQATAGTTYGSVGIKVWIYKKNSD